MRIEPDPVAVGRDIDAYCTKCRMDLGHTIIAMVGEKVVQVRCNTCGGVHRYKAAKSQAAAKAPAAKTRRAAAPKKEGTSVRRTTAVPKATPKERFTEWHTTVGQMSEEEGRDARTYAMREIFDEGELVRHPKFGLGKVLRIEPDDKIVVLFREGEKRLVANRA